VKTAPLSSKMTSRAEFPFFNVFHNKDMRLSPEVKHCYYIYRYYAINITLIILTFSCNIMQVDLLSACVSIWRIRIMNETISSSGRGRSNPNENIIMEFTMAAVFVAIIIFSAIVLLGN
jgi:hypothetical protein